MTKETRIARDGLALEEENVSALSLARQHIDGHDRDESEDSPECVRYHEYMERGEPAAFCSSCVYLAADELAEAVIAMEAELERRRYITVGVRDLLFKSTDRNVWLLAATLNYACDDVEELPEDCLVAAALDPKQGAADE